MAHENIEYGMDDVKELFDSSVMTGTIIEVDYGSDTATVAIDGVGQKSGVAIFYHCAGAETVAGGSLAFLEGDSVYIVNKAGSMKIVGFTDGLKQCAFQFKITRDDEKIIDASYEPVFQILNSNKDDVTGDATYDSETEYWTITVDPAYEVDPEGYWVSFIGIEDSIDLQYPFRYKYDDQEQTADLIRVGSYEAAVPFWKYSSHWRFDGVEWEVGDPLPYIGYGCPGFSFVNQAESIAKVQSSIEYQVTYVVESLTSLAQRYYTESGPYCESNGWKVGLVGPDIPWNWGSKDAEATFSITSTDGHGPITLKAETLDEDSIHPGSVGSEIEHRLNLDVSTAPGVMPFDTGITGCTPPTKEFSASYIGTYINMESTFDIMVVSAQYDY